MANTIYALICFGGNGRTVTMTIASPCVVTLTRHGLRTGSGVYFSTTGTLPTGISAGTKYYAKETAANTFNIYTDRECTNLVNTSGTQSGTHTIYGEYYYELTAAQKNRYIYNGNTFIYSSLLGFRDGLTTYFTNSPDAQAFVIGEFGDAFTDKAATAGVTFGFTCDKAKLTSLVNGVRSAAFHAGVPGNGYIMQLNGSTQFTFNLNMYNIEVEGLSFQNTTANGGAIGNSSAAFIDVHNNIFMGDVSVTGQKVCQLSSPGIVHHNIVVNGGGDGIVMPQYGGLGCKYYNNIVTKCTGIGINSEGVNQGLFYNNISVGNSTNWGPPPTYSAHKASNNYGEPDDIKSVTVDIAVSTVNINIPAHGKAVGARITFETTGTLPAITLTGAPLIPGKTYIVRSVVSTDIITLSTTSTGAAFVFTSNGTGTHTTTAIWSGDGTEKYIDMTNPETVFKSWTNTPYDLQPASASAPQVDTGMTMADVKAVDMLGVIRPNYSAGTATADNWDGGCFEYDSGNGLAPISVPINITNIVADSSVTLEDMVGGVILAPVIVTGNSYSFTYTYTGDVNVLLKVRNRRNGNWQPYEQVGVITANGCNFYVSQVGAIV